MPISKPVQVFPNDLRPSVGIGVDIPFNKPGVFTPNYQTKDAIKNNLINYFLTNTGERFMNPSFGGGLREFLFEQITTNNVNNLQDIVQDRLNLNFPNINLTSMRAIPDQDNYSISIFMQYSVRNTNINDSIAIEFNQ